MTLCVILLLISLVSYLVVYICQELL